MDPASTLQLWIKKHGSTGFLVRIEGTETDMPVGPNDWQTTVGHLVYLPIWGDRVHVHHLDEVREEGEEVAIRDGPITLMFSYWWTAEQRAQLDRWEAARMDLDIPALLAAAAPKAVL